MKKISFIWILAFLTIVKISSNNLEGNLCCSLFFDCVVIRWIWVVIYKLFRKLNVV